MGCTYLLYVHLAFALGLVWGLRELWQQTFDLAFPFPCPVDFRDIFPLLLLPGNKGTRMHKTDKTSFRE
jgi:hypothetical protein